MTHDQSRPNGPKTHENRERIVRLETLVTEIGQDVRTLVKKQNQISDMIWKFGAILLAAQSVFEVVIERLL